MSDDLDFSADDLDVPADAADAPGDFSFLSETEVNERPVSSKDSDSRLDRTAEWLARTKPWVRLISVVMFIVSLLLVLISLLMMLSRTTPVGALGGTIYILTSLLYIIPAVYLWRYARGIEHFLRQRTPSRLASALEAQKSFWKFMGILTLVMLVIYGISFCVLAGPWLKRL